LSVLGAAFVVGALLYAPSYTPLDDYGNPQGLECGKRD